MALHERVEGTAKRGCPRTKWMSSVLARYDAGPQALMRIVQDRDRWHLALTHARAHVECNELHGDMAKKKKKNIYTVYIVGYQRPNQTN